MPSSGLPAVGVDEAARGAAAAAVDNGGVFRRKLCPWIQGFIAVIALGNIIHSYHCLLLDISVQSTQTDRSKLRLSDLTIFAYFPSPLSRPSCPSTTGK